MEVSTISITHAPNSQTYRRDYERGWRAAASGSDGCLERADLRDESHAWYDGFSARSAGLAKWSQP